MDMLKYSDQHPEYKKSDCLTSYFDQGEATWEEVVLAVAQYPVNKTDLARNIAQKYLPEGPSQANILLMLECCN